MRSKIGANSGSSSARPFTLVKIWMPRAPIFSIARSISFRHSGTLFMAIEATQPLLLFRSVTDHVVEPSSSRRVLQGISSRDVTETLLENSYHVATLDNDAPRIFDDTAAFVTGVSRDA